MGTEIHTSPKPANDDPTCAAGKPDHGRLEMLDGWRAISIFTVIASHMLPLGPRRWALNEPVSILGMAIFFVLSGFLVVSILLRDQNILAFAIKRLARILPLAWTVLIVALIVLHGPLADWAANLIFYANLPPFPLRYGAHFWSLGVEMQFYLGVGLVVATAGARGLWIVPVVAAVVTLSRIALHETHSIVTWFRVDEILAGGTLALLLHTYTAPTRRWLSAIPFPLVLVVFLLSGFKELAWIAYARPYLAATMIGVTVARQVRGLSFALVSRPARYIASISYALYVFHPYTVLGWLGSGGPWARYAKRPLCFALTWGLAHFSTFRFEQPINRWAHSAASAISNRKRLAPRAAADAS